METLVNKLFNYIYEFGLRSIQLFRNSNKLFGTSYTHLHYNGIILNPIAATKKCIQVSINNSRLGKVFILLNLICLIY